MRETQKKRILVVEDDVEFAELLRRNLERAGFEVHEAVDGKEGLRLLFELKPDLVLLDLMMPVMDGEEFISVKTRYLTVDDIPIVVLSARESAPHPAVSLALRKPVELDKVVEIVRAHCAPALH